MRNYNECFACGFYIEHYELHLNPKGATHLYCGDCLKGMN